MNKEDFANQMWLTYKARFNAHSRLLRQEALYTVTISFLSLFVIALNILQLMPDFFPMKQNATTFYTITISIFILIVSLINNFSTRKHNADRFHACALEIKGLYGKFSAKLSVMTDDDYLYFIQKYNFIEKKYDINHSIYDYHQVLIEREKSNFKNISFNIKYFFRNYIVCSMLLLVPIVFGIFIVFA
jgi:hypothetical protein